MSQQPRPSQDFLDALASLKSGAGIAGQLPPLRESPKVYTSRGVLKGPKAACLGQFVRNKAWLHRLSCTTETESIGWRREAIRYELSGAQADVHVVDKIIVQAIQEYGSDQEETV